MTVDSHHKAIVPTTLEIIAKINKALANLEFFSPSFFCDK